MYTRLSPSKHPTSKYSYWQRVALLKISLRLLVAALGVYATGVYAADDSEASANWLTDWAEGGGVSLEHSFDSSGPHAWNSSEHPLVFISSEGPGYGGFMSGMRLPGIVIIDADTHEIVASQNYDVLEWGWKNVFEPHGLGVSPDGKWIYLPTGEGSFGTTGASNGRFLVVNAHTLKLDKVIKIPGQAHHAKSYRTPAGEQRVMLYAFNGALVVLDPDQDNQVVGGVFRETMQGDQFPYLYFMSPEGDTLVATGANYLNRGPGRPTSNLYFFDPENWKLSKKVPFTRAR